MAEEYAAEAVTMLRRARSAGAFDEAAMREQVRKDPDLEALRDREDFQSLLRELEGQDKAC